MTSETIWIPNLLAIHIRWLESSNQEGLDIHAWFLSQNIVEAKKKEKSGYDDVDGSTVVLQLEQSYRHRLPVLVHLTKSASSNTWILIIYIILLI